MDYSYLNQAAASFDTNCLQNGMDPSSLVNMPCSYSDLTSCSQMSQAYRYTAAAASMARSYNPVQSGVGAGGAVAMTGLHHPGAPSAQCTVMSARGHHQDVHRSSVFTSSMGMQCKLFALIFTVGKFLIIFSFIFIFGFLLKLFEWYDACPQQLEVKI